MKKPPSHNILDMPLVKDTITETLAQGTVLGYDVVCIMTKFKDAYNKMKHTLECGYKAFKLVQAR